MLKVPNRNSVFDLTEALRLCKSDQRTVKMPIDQNDISELRDQVDAIDDQIIELIAKRIELATLIMKSKRGSQLVDSGREQSIVQRYSEKLADLSTVAKTQKLVSGIIEASKFYPGA